MPRRRREAASDQDGLIDWNEPSRNMHILDWRERAREFGLLPDSGDHPEFVEPPEQLIREEEPEAIESQPIEAFRRHESDADEAADAAALDVDPVRVYLK